MYVEMCLVSKHPLINRLVQIAVHVNNQLDFALHNKLKFYIGIPKQRGVEPSQVPLPLQVLALLPSK